MRNIFGILSRACKNSPFLTLFVAFIVYVLFSMLFVPLLFGVVSTVGQVSFEQLADWIQGDLDDAYAQSIVRLLQGTSQLLTWGLAAIVMADLLGNPWETLRLKAAIQPIFLLLAPFIVIISIPLVQGLSFDAQSFQLGPLGESLEAWVHKSEARGERLLKNLLYTDHFPTYILNLLVFACIPAITEELFFRGIIQKTMYRMSNAHLAIWGTALFFSLAHLQFYGFFSRLFLGAALGYTVYGAGNLLPAILGHFVFNAVTVSSLYQAGLYGVDPDILWDDNGIPLTFWLIGVSSLGVIALFIVYFRQAKAHNSMDV